MDERGKLKFPEAEVIKNDKKLKKVKDHWESFAESEEGERDRYLRSLEVQFSMNSMVEGRKTEEATDFMTEVFAQKKVDQPEASLSEQIAASKDMPKNRATDKK